MAAVDWSVGNQVIDSESENSSETVEGEGERQPPTSLSVSSSRQLGWGSVGGRWYEQAALVLRALWLLAVFLPLLVSGPVLYWLSRQVAREEWRRALQGCVWRLIRFGLEQGGAAFIKWGQVRCQKDNTLFPSSSHSLLMVFSLFYSPPV